MAENIGTGKLLCVAATSAFIGALAATSIIAAAAFFMMGAHSERPKAPRMEPRSQESSPRAMPAPTTPRTTPPPTPTPEPRRPADNSATPR